FAPKFQPALDEHVHGGMIGRRPIEATVHDATLTTGSHAAPSGVGRRRPGSSGEADAARLRRAAPARPSVHGSRASGPRAANHGPRARGLHPADRRKESSLAGP